MAEDSYLASKGSFWDLLELSERVSDVVLMLVVGTSHMVVSLALPVPMAH